MAEFYKYECRRYEPDLTKTWLIVNDQKSGEIGRVLIDMPFPRNHDFWGRDGNDPWVKRKLTKIYKIAKDKKDG